LEIKKASEEVDEKGIRSITSAVKIKGAGGAQHWGP